MLAVWSRSAIWNQERPIELVIACLTAVVSSWFLTHTARQTVLIHALLSFAYNTVLVALALNIFLGFIGQNHA